MTEAADNGPTPSPVGEPNTFYATPVWKRLFAFLIGPALLAAVGLAVFTTISVLTRETESPQELVQALRTGGEHRRWQAAFALTKYLQPSLDRTDTKVRLEEDAAYRAKLAQVRLLVPELLATWNDAERGRGEVRRFLALAFGYLADPRLVPALADALDDTDIETVHYALAAIATTIDVAGPKKALNDASYAAIQAAAKRPEADIRATAVYVLGVTGRDDAAAQVESALEDGAAAVRWNAAFALARQRNAAGETTIMEILDRGPAYQAAGPDPVRQQDLFLNAVRSAAMLQTTQMHQRLGKIASSDENLRARDLARTLLNEADKG